MCSMLALDFLEMSQGHLCHNMKNINILEKKKSIFSNCTITDCSISLVKCSMPGLFIFPMHPKDLILNCQLLILLKDG